jgi:hypothetical protein
MSKLFASSDSSQYRTGVPWNACQCATQQAPHLARLRLGERSAADGQLRNDEGHSPVVRTSTVFR